MARPKSTEKRTKRFHVLYSEREHAQMISNARDACLEPGVYARHRTAGVSPDKKLPSKKEEALLHGVAALQQISKNFEQVKDMVSDDIMKMMRTELMAVRQLITKALEK
jgi:hypothetical protein